MRDLATLGWRRLKILFEREQIDVGYDRLRIYRANGLRGATTKEAQGALHSGNGDCARNGSKPSLVGRLHA
jgi:hypothetical protein